LPKRKKSHDVSTEAEAMTLAKRTLMAALIYQARVDAGLSQRVLAAKAKLSSKLIQQAEQGKVVLTDEQYGKLWRAMGVIN
jgi:ribosome-binding protein aMBF1 (putative translation factor)